MVTNTTRLVLGLGVIALLSAPAPLRLAAQQASRIGPEVYSRLAWRHIGPEGNRISAVAGVPGQPLVYYAGSASGGIRRAPTPASANSSGC